MSLPVARVVLPTSLVGAVNGVLDPSLLAPIGDRGQLHHLAARAWRPLVTLAAEAGFGLTYTYGGTYRSYGEQVNLFRQRYTAKAIPNAPSKVWGSTRYWQLPHTAMAAVPGTSNHGIGLAVDSAIGSGPANATDISPRLPWMLDTAPQFGWSWETQSEAWHIRYVAGDDVPPAVIAYEASLGLATPATPVIIQPATPSASATRVDTASTPAIRGAHDMAIIITAPNRNPALLEAGYAIGVGPATMAAPTIPVLPLDDGVWDEIVANSNRKKAADAKAGA